MHQYFKLCITLIMSALLFSQSALARDCYEQSPNYNETYFDLEETAKLTKAQAEQIKATLAALKGEWEGESIAIDCWGPDNAAYTSSNNSNIKLKAKVASNSSLSINAQKHNVERRIKQVEIVNLLGSPQVFDFSFSNNGTDFAFSEKFRRLNNNGNKNEKTNRLQNSRLNEIIYEVNPGKGTFKLTRYFYTNGVYIGEDQWSMHRN